MGLEGEGEQKSRGLNMKYTNTITWNLCYFTTEGETVFVSK